MSSDAVVNDWGQQPVWVATGWPREEVCEPVVYPDRSGPCRARRLRPNGRASLGGVVTMTAVAAAATIHPAFTRFEFLPLGHSRVDGKFARLRSQANDPQADLLGPAARCEQIISAQNSIRVAQPTADDAPRETAAP